MRKPTTLREEVGGIVQGLLDDYKGDKFIDHINMFNKPEKAEVQDLVDRLFQIVLPGYYKDTTYRTYNPELNFSVTAEDVFNKLQMQIKLGLGFKRDGKSLTDYEATAEAYRCCRGFFRKLPQIREYIDTDLQAAFDGDPAAGSKEEVILAYPGFFAITVARMAHELYLMDVPVIPRLMTEYAHTITGVDIHPGATIGKYFFIDHCTGVVIGETAVIGEHVKLYQGVTLGAISTRGGQRLKDVRRHPTIEDNVTIYSGAVVLGGKTVIGENSVIGGGVFLTSSVPKNTQVSMSSPELVFRNGDEDFADEEEKHEAGSDSAGE